MAYCNKPIMANIFCSRSVGHTILINVKKGIACEELLLFKHTLYEESVKQIQIRPRA